MKRFAIGLIAASFVLTSLAGPAMAKTTKMAAKTKTAASKTMKCPACGMAMPTKKTASMTVPVKIKGTTYYCCSMCPAAKAHMKSGAKSAAKKM